MYVYYRILDVSTGEPIPIDSEVEARKVDSHTGLYSVPGQALRNGDGSWTGVFLFRLNVGGKYVIKWSLPNSQDVHTGVPIITVTKEYKKWDFELDLPNDTTQFTYSDLHSMDVTFPEHFANVPIIKQTPKSDLKYYVYDITVDGFSITKMMGALDAKAYISILIEYDKI